MAKIENLLAECLDDLERGISVDECLARYPEQREELEPLLLAAQHVRSAPEVGPSPAFRQHARARMVRQISERQSARNRRTESKRPTLLERLWPDLRIPAVVARLAVPAVTAMIVLGLLGMVGVGAVYASSNSLPGDSLYPVKLASERARLALSFGEIRDARLHMRFASERLEEAAALVARRGTDDIEPLMAKYIAEIEAASGAFQHQRARVEDMTSLSAHIRAQLAEHQMVLNWVREEAADEARPAVEQALAASQEAQERILEPPVPPEGSPTGAWTATAKPSATSQPTETPRLTDTVEPAQRTEPTATSVPPGRTKTAEAPGLTKTPQPPGQTMTPEPPGLTHTPQPPGQTRTPEPPGLTHTPQPPGQTRTPEPPGLTHTPQPPGLTRTPGAP